MFYIAFLSFVVGLIAAIYLVNPVARPFRKIEKIKKEIEQKGCLLDAVNRAASMLTGKPPDGQDLEQSFYSCMDILGKNIEADSVLLWKNEMIEGRLHAVLEREWLSTGALERRRGTERLVEVGFSVPYDSVPWWEHKFTWGEYVNSPVALLSPEERTFLEPFAVKSIIIIPLLVENRFWGILGLNDCESERTLSNDEIIILRGAGTMMAVAAEHTEQERKMRAQIEQANKYTQLMLDSLPLVCVLFNLEHEIIGCNKKALTLFGFENLTELKERFFSLVPEYQPDGMTSAEAADRYIDKAFEEGSQAFNWEHTLRDGTNLPTQVELVRCVYENNYVVAGYMKDLREYNQMIADIEQRDHLLYAVNRVAGLLLRPETENFANNIGQSMEIMARAADADRMYIWKNYTENGNLYCVQIYEWFENVVSCRDCGMTGGVLYDEFAPHFKEIFLRGENVNSLVRDVPTSEQKMLSAQNILSVLLVPIFIRDEFWGFVGFDSCHSERLFTGNEETILQSTSLLITNALLRNEYIRHIQETSGKLETALAETQETSVKLEIALAETQEASAKLEAVLAETQNANNAKSDFLANMSHEMRTPLNAIMGLSELTLAHGNLSVDTAANVEKIYNSGSMLWGIVNDILDISKIEAGKFEMIQSEYDTPGMVNDCVNQNIMRISSKPIKFMLNINENMPEYLCGDVLLVKRIINNLLSNAFKYTEKGTVELSLDCESCHETVLGGVVWLIIKVSDTGIGIKPEHLERIFSDYSQFEATPSRRTDGTGLGLSITKRLTDMMGGTIGIESEYGKGSVFTVKIRQRYVSDAVVSAAVRENLKNLRYSSGKRSRRVQMNILKLPYARVLLVDDNVTNLDVAKGMLMLYEMQIDCVASGQEAIDAIREEKVKYNAVFMDHMMPVMDGIEAARIIREEIGTEYAITVPIIALTANAVTGSEDMFLSKGFQAFISKPIDMLQLDEVVRTWVRDLKEEARLGMPPEFVERRAGKDRRVSERRSKFLLRALARETDRLDLFKGLRRFKSEKSYLHILRVYAENTKPLLYAIAGVSAETLPEYTVTVHGIKSSSRGICADALGDLAETMEHAARAGNLDFVAQNNPAFLETAWELIKDIGRILDKTVNNVTKPQKDKPDSEILTMLRSACDNYDFNGIGAAMKEIEKYEYTSDGGLAEWLHQNVTQMNFTQVVEKISRLPEEE